MLNFRATLVFPKGKKFVLKLQKSINPSQSRLGGHQIICELTIAIDDGMS